MFKNKYKNLNIGSSDIKNGILDNNFGGYGSQPKVSFELHWDKVDNAKSYGLYFIDYDAIHVVGFPFIHWVVLNIKTNGLRQNATYLDRNDITQGQNSRTTVGWLNTKGNKISTEEFLKDSNYTGPYPPDESHIYKVVVFALDKEKIDLQDGFFMDEMLKMIDNHILAYDELNFKYIKPN